MSRADRPRPPVRIRPGPGGAVCLLVLVLLVVGRAPSDAADWVDQGPVLTVIEENDLFINTDRHYTQGAKLSFLHGDCDLRQPAKDCISPLGTRWLARNLPVAGFTPSVTKFGYQLGQSIFTPTNVKATEVQKDDRPYAGWLYTGLILQRRGMMSDRWPVLENFQLDLGVIGPHSYAEDAQTKVHEWRGFDVPKGWRHQLHDEPGLALKYERSWLFSPNPSGTRYVDLIPRAGMSLGNVDTSFRIGGMARLGVNLPNDFGVETISSLTTTAGGRPRNRAGGQWGFYVFGESEVSTVLYTAFLDGNLFRSSHSVDKQTFVAEWKGGAVVVLDVLELAMTYAYRTPQFVGQRRDDGYGSISVKVRF